MSLSLDANDVRRPPEESGEIIVGCLTLFRRCAFFAVVPQDYDLQRQLAPLMKDTKPLPSIYFPDFIAANQSDRADNVLKGSKQEQMDKVKPKSELTMTCRA